MTDGVKSKLKERDELPDNLFDTLAETCEFGSNHPTLRSAIRREGQIEDDVSLHFHVRIGRIHERDAADFCLVVEGPDTNGYLHGSSSTGAGCDSSWSGCHEVRQAMLIVVGESMEHPEQIIVRALANARLKPIDDDLRVDWKRANLLSPGFCVGRRGGEDGKFGAGSRVRSAEQGQLPSQMIKSGTEMRQHFPGQYPNQYRNLIEDLDAVGIGSLLSIEIGHDFVGTTTKKAGNLAVQGLEMVNGPADLSAYVLQLTRKNSHA